MSYCRWSDLDFGCDIYAYESEAGYIIHVAGQRIVGDVPKVTGLSVEPWKVFWAAVQAQYRFVESAERQPIGLPYDDETFEESSLDEFEDRLHELRDLGYCFPDYIFNMIAEERLEKNDE